MVRRLILMRHAKSSWSSGAPTDHARPLNKRGRQASKAMGTELRRRGWTPDVVALSDSARTQETLRRMRLDADVAIRLVPALYHGGPEEVRAVLADQSEAKTLLVLGHQPGWSEAVAWLSGTSVELKTADAALMTARSAQAWPTLVAAPERFDLLGIIRSREVMGSPLPPEA